MDTLPWIAYGRRMAARYRIPDVCIVGTLESTGGVYRRVLANSAEIGQSALHCLGANSCVALAVAAGAIAFDHFDLCLLDFAVADARVLQDGAASDLLLRSVLEDGVRRILQAGCLPALLVLPLSSMLGSNNARISEIYHAVATHYRLPVFDGYQYLEFLARQGVDSTTLFAEDGRLRDETAAEMIGLCLDGAILAHAIRTQLPPLDEAVLRYAYVDFTTPSPTAAEDLPRQGISLYAGHEIAAIATERRNRESSGAATPFRLTISPVEPPIRVKGPDIIQALSREAAGGQRSALRGVVVRQVARESTVLPLRHRLIISDAAMRRIDLQRRAARRWEKPVHYFDSLPAFLSRADTPSGLYVIKMLGLFFDLMVENRGAATTIVSFHPDLPATSEYQLPVIAGEELEQTGANLILVSDPGLQAEPPLGVGGYVGLRGCPVQEILPHLVQSLHAAIGGSRLIFTGVQSGGFAALFYSYGTPGSLCITANPVVLFEQHVAEPSRSAFCQTRFGIDDAAAVRELFDTEIEPDLLRLYHRGFENFLVYCQDVGDSSLQQHAEPFLDALPESHIGQVVLVRGQWHAEGGLPPQPAWTTLLAEAARWTGSWAEFVTSDQFGALGKVVSHRARVYPRRQAACFEALLPGSPVEAVMFFGQSNAGAPGTPVTTMREARYPARIFGFSEPQRYGSEPMPAGSNWDFEPLRNPHACLFIQTPAAFALAEHEFELGTPPPPRFFHTVWYGGRPIEAFLPGTPAYACLLNAARDVRSIARAYGRQSRVGAIVWIQGEARSENYAADLDRLIASFAADLALVSPQPGPPIWLIAQTNNPSGESDFSQTALDQLAIAMQRDDAVLIGPMYQLPFLPGDLIHPDEHGRLMYGELAALVYETVVVRGERFEPLHPVALAAEGNRLILRFHLPELPLQWDESWVLPAAHYGFAVERNGSLIEIDAVAITGPDTVELTLREPAAGGRVLYAMGQGEPANDWAGARGQLCSPTSRASLYHREGHGIPPMIMHYCVRFALTIPDA